MKDEKEKKEDVKQFALDIFEEAVVTPDGLNIDIMMPENATKPTEQPED